MSRQQSDEIAFQATRAAQIEVQRTNPREIERYRRNRRWRFYRSECFYRLLGNLEGKSLLDFGCGDGVDSVIYSALGARVTGIDLSEELVEVARRRAAVNGVDGRFVAGDILALDSLGQFDVVAVNATLHHVDIFRVVPRLLECVRPGGRIVISEPMQPCRLLQVIRRLVPIHTEASPDEHPLTPEELAFVLKSVGPYEFYRFDFFGRLGRYFRGVWLLVLGVLDRIVLTVAPSLAATFVLGAQPDARQTRAE